MSSFDFITNEEARKKLEESLPRIQRAYGELFSGYDLTAESVLNEVVLLDEPYTGIVTEKDINFYTFCGHHFLPFFGTASISYEPGKILTGIGKLIRIVRDVHSRRLQIQELMARDIAQDIERVLGAKGVRVELTARHMCTCSRGPSDDTAVTKVVYELGSLRRPIATVD